MEDSHMVPTAHTGSSCKSSQATNQILKQMNNRPYKVFCAQMSAQEKRPRNQPLRLIPTLQSDIDPC